MNEDMKEIWFRKELSSQIQSRQLKRTFRELPASEKNNNYQAGELVLARIHDGQGHTHGRFEAIFSIRVTGVYVRRIEELEESVFRLSDANSKEDLIQRLSVFYKRPYGANIPVRVIDFEYITLS